MRYLLTLGLLAAVGCTAPEQEARYAPPEQIEWSFEDVKKNTNDIAELKGTVSALKMFIEPRSMQKPLDIKASSMRVSTARVRGDETVKLEEPKSVTPEQFQAFQSQVMKKLETVSAAKSVVEAPPFSQSYSSAPVKSYASGPKTYGAARTTGTRTVTKTRKVAKTVYEEVPYEVQEPVMTRPVYQTQVEEYQEPVQRTVMKTETRQRTKTVMVPQQVTENYSVQVPETVTEMVTKTRSKRVQVGTEEVKAPRFSSAAPSYSSSVCEPAPKYSEPISYSVEAPRFSVSQPVEQFVEAFQSPPVQSFSITEPVVYSQPTQTYSQPVQTVSTPVCTGPNCQYSSAAVCTGPNCQVSSAPSYSSAPTFSSNPKPPRTRSRLTLSRQPVQTRQPVQSFRTSRPRPVQNSAQNFSSSRGGEGLVIIK